jgi:hypothetical protein
MFKATHKGRATTLSKTLLTAGLLGGAALTTLGAGSAQAAWTPDPIITPTSNSYACTFGGAVACAVGDPTTHVGSTGIVGAPPNPSDKILTLLDWGLADGTSAIGDQLGIADGSTLVFQYQTPDSHPWHVDVDLAGNDVNGGFLKYKVEITDPSQFFSSAMLAGQLQSNNPDLTKQIYSDSTFTTEICNITIGPSATQTCSISGKQIWVKDTWQAGAGVDNFANDFSQTSVPGPLPLLGAGAAFGFSRRIRSRIKGARLA